MTNLTTAAISARFQEATRRRQVRDLNEISDLDPFLTPSVIEFGIGISSEAELAKRVHVLFQICDVLDLNPLWLVFGIGAAELPAQSFLSESEDLINGEYRQALRLAVLFSVRHELPGSAIITLWRALDSHRRNSLALPNSKAATTWLPTSFEEINDFWNAIARHARC